MSSVAVLRSAVFQDFQNLFVKAVIQEKGWYEKKNIYIYISYIGSCGALLPKAMCNRRCSQHLLLLA